MTHDPRAGFWRLADPKISLASMASIALGAAAAALAGMALAFFYHGAPLRLSYRGLGELAVAVAYGPVICAGTYLVQRGAVPSRVVLLGVPLGLLIGAFLWINEFPDHHADRAAGKRTLVVRLGRPAAARAFAVIVAAALAGIALLPLGGWPLGVLGGLVAVVPASRAARTLLATPEDTVRIVPAQAQTLLAFLLATAGSGVGLLAWR